MNIPLLRLHVKRTAAAGLGGWMRHYFCEKATCDVFIEKTEEKTTAFCYNGNIEGNDVQLRGLGEGISMKYKAVKEILQWSLTVFLSVSAVAAVSIFMNGMYLLGIPDPEDVQGVVAEYPGIPDEKKESTDRETVWWKGRPRAIKRIP